jgi:hypothetical protein
MPVRLHRIVVDAHDPPGLARFWTQALGWVLSERERKIVIGTDENAPAGMCFMPAGDTKMVKNCMHLDLALPQAQVTLQAARADAGNSGSASGGRLEDRGHLAAGRPGRRCPWPGVGASPSPCGRAELC